MRTSEDDFQPAWSGILPGRLSRPVVYFAGGSRRRRREPVRRAMIPILPLAGISEISELRGGS